MASGQSVWIVRYAVLFRPGWSVWFVESADGVGACVHAYMCMDAYMWVSLVCGCDVSLLPGWMDATALGAIVGFIWQYS